MKRLFVCALGLAALIVTYNVRTRAGTPAPDFETVLPWIAQNPALNTVAMQFMKPGAAALWYLGADLNSGWEITLDFLISWYAWLFCARCVWFWVGRRLGLAPLSSFHWWTKCWLPWRPIFRLYVKFAIWRKQLRYGSMATGSWTSPVSAAARLYTGGDQVPIGRLWAFGFKFTQPIAVAGKTHIAVAAKTGAGKTTWGGWVIGETPDDGAALVIDTDGELASVIGSGLRDRGHLLFVLDPYGLSIHPSCCWNPLDEVTKAVERHGIEAAVRYAQMLADALVPELNQMQQIFTQTARRGLCGIILFVWLFEPPERRNLVRVRALAALGMPEAVSDPAKQSPHEALYAFMKRMPDMVDDGCNGQITAVIASAAEALRSGKNREGGNPFLSTLLTATSWIQIPEFAITLMSSDFTCQDLKLGNPCVVLVLPVIDIQGVANGYVAVFSKTVFYVFENINERPQTPCLFFMDEAANIKLPYLDQIAPTARRHGLRLVVIFQDIPLLRSAYPETWTSFLSNAMALIAMATDDLETLKYYCDLCGKKTLRVRVDGPHWIWNLFGVSKEKARYQLVQEDLMTVDQMREFLNRARGQLIAFPAGEPPIRLGLEGYTTALALWQYRPSRHYRETPLRAFTRKILSQFWLRVKPDDGKTKATS